MSHIRNVLVQLGEPLSFPILGDGMVQTDTTQGVVLSAKTSVAQRSALSRIVSGSWVCRIDVLATSSGFASFRVGVLPEQGRKGLVRPSQKTRPQDWSAQSAGVGAVVVDRNGNVYRDGALIDSLSALGVGTALYLMYSAATNTLRFRVEDPNAGGITVTNVGGPLRLIASVGSSSVSLRFVHDLEHLPRVAGYRPMGVWGRVASIGVMDTVRGDIWEGRIASEGDPTFEHALSFAVMGHQRRSGSVGDITVINTPDHPHEARRALDDWLEWSTRDEPFTILRGTFGEALSTYSVVARGVIDSISEPREGQLAISCRDPSALLDTPWQWETYPDTTPLASLRGRSKPTLAGTCRAAPLVERDASLLHYDVSDDAINLSPTPLVYDRGVLLTLGTGYALTQDRCGLKRLTNPAGLQSVTASGAALESEVAIGATTGDFVQWAGTPSAPRGWTNPSTGTGTSVTSTANGARFVRGSTGQAELLCAGAMTLPSGQFRVDIEIAAHASGVLNVQFETATGTVGGGVSIATSAGLGKHTFITPKFNLLVNLRLRVADAAGDITVRSLRVSRLNAISTLAQHLRWAICYRGGFEESLIHPSVDSATHPLASVPLCLATSVGDSRTILSVLNELTASTASAWWFDAEGALRNTFLVDPSSMVASVSLDDSNLIGDIRITPDTASALSTRVACDPTWAAHAEADIADSLRTTEAGRTFAGALLADYGAIKTASEKPDGGYAFSLSAPPINTLLQTDAGGQLLANHLSNIYRQPRAIYQCSAEISELGLVMPGDVVNLSHAGMSKNLMVLSVNGRYASDITDLTLWG